MRGAFAVDVADVTGDDLADVIVTSPDQMQMVLYVQPESVSDRGFDWYTASIVTFESYEPRSVKALDVDNDGTLELVVGGTQGAMRYFDPPASPIDEWQGHIILTYDPAGDVGLLGYGDLDGDGRCRSGRGGFGPGRELRPRDVDSQRANQIAIAAMFGVPRTVFGNCSYEARANTCRCSLWASEMRRAAQGPVPCAA